MVGTTDAPLRSQNDAGVPIWGANQLRFVDDGVHSRKPFPAQFLEEKHVGRGPAGIIAGEDLTKAVVEVGAAG